MKTKSDFIKALLAEKNIRSQEREKILELSALELSLNEIKIENELNSFKKTLSAIKEENKKDISDFQIQLNEIKQTIEKNETVHIEPNPKHVADFMSLFNQREGLKYLTHDYDEDSEFKIDKFLKDAHIVFRKKTSGPNRLYIPVSLWKIVEQFAFRGKEQPEWTSISNDYKKSIKHKIGWASQDLRKWSKENKLHPIENEEYEQVINDFKRITRIKEPDFEKLICTTLDKIFKNDLQSYSIEQVQLKKADFYTHVLFLKTAIESIFEMIKDAANRSGSRKLKIEYKRDTTEDDYYIRKILITHYNSYPNKELALICKEWNSGKGSMGKVRNKLNGYCHWSVETIIDEKPTRVYLLKDDFTPEFEIIQDSIVEGFTHILTFYYK